jgi:hypothetical protein
MARLEQVDWSGIWGKLQKGFAKLFERISPWLEQKVNELRTLVWDRIGKWWSEIDWDEVVGTVGDMAGALWTAVQPALSELGDMIGQWFADHWIDIVLISSAALVGAFVALVLLAIGAAVAILLAPIGAAFLFWSEAWERWGDDLIAFFSGLGEWIAEQWTALTDLLSGVWDRFTSWFAETFPNLSRAVSEAVDEWRGRFQAIGTAFMSLWEGVVTWWSTLWGSEGGIGGPVSSFWTWLSETASVAFNWIVENLLPPFMEAFTAIWTLISEYLQFTWDNIMGIIDIALAFIVDLLSQGPAEAISNAWDGTVEFFQDMFNRIVEALSPVTSAFSTLANIGRSALRSILGEAEEDFGNSINTVVAEDMVATEEVMTETALRISEMMQDVLYGATVRAIVDGFATGFAQVVENMGEFTVEMVDAFSSLNDQILAITANLFATVITQAEVTMIAAETAVEGIIGNLRTITIAQERLASARSEAIESLSRPADEEAVRRRLAQLAGSEVLQAIHHPDWYSGFGNVEGYRTLFVRHMTSLRTAIESMSVAPASGTLEERRRQLRTATEALQGGPGGHPRVPGGPGR